MQFLEFLDAFARIADRVIVPTTSTADELPLHLKIEKYLNRVALMCMGEEYAFQHRKKQERRQRASKRRRKRQ